MKCFQKGDEKEMRGDRIRIKRERLGMTILSVSIPILSQLYPFYSPDLQTTFDIKNLCTKGTKVCSKNFMFHSRINRSENNVH